MAAFAKSRPAPALGVAAGALSERSWRVMLVGGCSLSSLTNPCLFSRHYMESDNKDFDFAKQNRVKPSKIEAKCP
jgi:hypothetical protein